MRKLKIFEHISLDGVIQHSADDGVFPYSDWTAPYRTPGGRDAVTAAQGGGFDLLLGRRTYDLWSSVWPKMPSSPLSDDINAATKYVATHRPESLEWGPFEDLGPDIVEGVRRIKSQEGPDLILWGSSTLTSKLLEYGLVDEVLLIVYPLLLGKGKRFFAEGTPPRSFELGGTKALSSGIVMNVYKAAGPLKNQFANQERLYAIDKELEIARRIQSMILPHEIPSIAGIVIAAHYVPMSAVSGDFYDFLRIDEKRVGILVADVAGHGVPAALIASMVKVALAGQAAHAEDPARVLSGLNRALCGNFEEHFVTAAYLFVDSEKGMLRYSAAGHPPLMLAAGATGEVREIEENGLMLGMSPEASYSFLEIHASPGDRCLLYTDGVVEARDGAHQEFGKSRCRALLGKHLNLPAARFAATLMDGIAEFSGHRHQEDDITFLVVDFQAQT